MTLRQIAMKPTLPHFPAKITAGIFTIAVAGACINPEVTSLYKTLLDDSIWALGMFIFHDLCGKMIPKKEGAEILSKEYKKSELLIKTIYIANNELGVIKVSIFVTVVNNTPYFYARSINTELDSYKSLSAIEQSAFYGIEVMQVSSQIILRKNIAELEIEIKEIYSNGRSSSSNI